MAAEKCFALYFPLQAKNICTVRNAMIISVVNTVVFLVYNIQWIFTLEKVYVKTIKRIRCQIFNAPDFLRFHWRDIDAIIASYIPMILMLIFNLGIIVLLCKNRDKGLGVGSSSRDMSKIAKQVTIMLLSVTCLFIILKCPVAIYFHTVGIYISNNPITKAILNNLIYVNSSINGFLYIISGSKYRDRALAIFKGCCMKISRSESSKHSSIAEVDTERQTI